MITVRLVGVGWVRLKSVFSCRLKCCVVTDSSLPVPNVSEVRRAPVMWVVRRCRQPGRGRAACECCDDLVRCAAFGAKDVVEDKCCRC